MKKHVAGFILFCFIVGSGVFISKGFILTGYQACPVLEDVIPPNVNMPVPEMKNYPVNKKSPVVRQAVINTASKELKVELLFDDDAFAAGEKSLVRLNYFKIDYDGPRFLTSETFIFFRESLLEENKDRTVFVNSYYKRLNDLNSYENLYVTVELVGLDYSLKNEPAEFDAKTAKEITVERGSSKQSKLETKVEFVD